MLDQSKSGMPINTMLENGTCLRFSQRATSELVKNAARRRRSTVKVYCYRFDDNQTGKGQTQQLQA